MLKLSGIYKIFVELVKKMMLIFFAGTVNRCNKSRNCILINGIHLYNEFVKKVIKTQVNMVLKFICFRHS